VIGRDELQRKTQKLQKALETADNIGVIAIHRN
jgi:hypothetical protein